MCFCRGAHSQYRRTKRIHIGLVTEQSMAESCFCAIKKEKNSLFFFKCDSVYLSKKFSMRDLYEAYCEDEIRSRKTNCLENWPRGCGFIGD